MKKLLTTMIIVSILILLVGCGSEPDIEVDLGEPEEVDEVPDFEEEEETDELVAPPEEEETMDEELDEVGMEEDEELPATTPARPTGPSNVVLVSQMTRKGRTLERTFDDTSMFSNIHCGDGEVSFTFVNDDEHDYYLGEVHFDVQREKNGLSFSLNGKDIRKDPVASCGTDTVKANEEISCTIKGLVRKGISHFGKELTNSVEASALFYNTKTVFKCAPE